MYDETNWSDPAKCDPYSRSKLLAEKAAWEFVEKLPESERFELVTINPTFVFGPPLIKKDFTSGGILKNIVTG